MKSIDKTFTQSKASIFLEVEPKDDGLRLDEACKTYLKSQSRESIKKMIHSGKIVIHNRKTKNYPHTKIKHMDIIEVYRLNEEASDKNLTFLYEDDHLIAIYKPKFMPVHPTGIHHFNVASVLVEKKLNIKIYPIHRLDIKTSGVLLFAKSKEVASKMRTLFDKKLIKKKYRFKSYIRKSLKEIPPSINLALEDDKEDNITLKQRVNPLLVKECITKFKNIKYDLETLEGEAYPLTGRLHQIRCHLSYLGAPIVGDNIYGEDPEESQLMLECIKLEFVHPITKSKLQITVDH